MDTEGKKRFPLREAYAFATAKGLNAEVAEVRDMEIEWDRPYTSTVRRGRMILLLERHGALQEFISTVWPFGLSTAGEADRRRCIRIAEEFAAFLAGTETEDKVESEFTAENSLEFALEAHLRDFLARNLEQVEKGLALYETDESNGVEFPVDGGRIDILATDADGKFVVIELKLAQGRNKALGQLLYYMGWIDQNLGKGPCRGIIIASDISPELAVAVSRVPGASLSRYKMHFSIEQVH
jgi:RecB family endonuclease NucS